MQLEVCENSICYIRLLARLAVVWSTVAWLILTISRYYGHFHEIFMIGAYEKSHLSGGDKLNYNLQTQNIKCNEKLSFIKNFCPAYSKIFYPLGLSHTSNVFVALYLKQFRF